MQADKDKTKEIIRKQEQWSSHSLTQRVVGEERQVMDSAAYSRAQLGKLFLERAGRKCFSLCRPR